MNLSGFHSHTTFSDGKNTPEEMIQEAIRLGMPAIGISDHSDTPCDQSYCMKKAQYGAYVAELTRLKEKYASQITVMRGIELDLDSDMAITEELDYHFASVHYLIRNGVVYAIDHARYIQLDCVTEAFGGDYHAFEEAYFASVVENVRRCKPYFVGHYDVITKFSTIDEQDPVYREIALDALKKVMEVTPVLEVNTGAISRKWRNRPYPGDFILEKLHEWGGDVVLGADTHAVETIDCYFEESLGLIKNAGFDHILTLGNDGFEKVPI